MYNLLHCLFFFSLDKPQTLMSLQRKHFGGIGSGGLQSNARRADQCCGAQAEPTPAPTTP